jgi:hypothetical protein
MGSANCRPFVPCSALDSVIDPRQAEEWPIRYDVGTTRTKYIEEKSVPIDCSLAQLDFRTLLDSPIAMRYFLKFASVNGYECLVGMWLECREWVKLKDCHRQRLCEMICLYSQIELMKTRFENASLSVHSFERKCNYAGSDEESMSILYDFFYALQKISFLLLFELVYTPFSQLAAFKSMCRLIYDPECWVTPDSFEYGGVIAEGSFGLVVRCRKKSTGTIFATKIQSKSAMLRHHKRDKSRVMTEMLVSCQLDHPFVCSLAYATQTAGLVLLVMPISICGDLSQALQQTENHRFSSQRVRFYAAEVLLALSYLHRCGLMYRDLKLGNILLNADGHIVLTDFGTVKGELCSFTTLR